jgi:biotin transport system substrate-specific component
MHTTLAPTITHRVLPRANALLRDGLLILVGSLIVAALAQVRIPLAFTPVPITGQTFAVLLVGAALGARRGAACLLLYLGQGLAGLPVFTSGGHGLAHLAGPTGGYLIGFVAAAAIVGALCERGLDRRWETALLPFLAGEAVIYLFALPWLALFVGASAALSKGLLPFLAGDLIKLSLAALLLPSTWRLLKSKGIGD